MEASFDSYLKGREEILSKYHPQWDLTNEEISSSSHLLKRDGTPICIPPSWDLVGKYAGPDDERADGFDGNIFEKEKYLFAGDQSEAQFLSVMRDLPIGGVLIGDIYSSELKHVPFFGNAAFSSEEPKLPEFFQIDFLYFHQSGIFPFEIKTSRNGRKDDEQLARNRQILKNIFHIFCRLLGEENDAELLENRYFSRSSIFYTNGNRKPGSPEATLDSVKIFGKENLNYFWLRPFDSPSLENFFKDKIYRNFLSFLAVYRPGYFTSPVKCALFVQNNIYAHYVNTLSYYRNNVRKESKIQNDAKNVMEFLQSLKFLSNTDIDFGIYANIYLTPKQQEVVGFFDGGGNFFPKRQLIFGPPGSGKSLILMLKIFILGQMETRKEKTLYYLSCSIEHRKKFSEFVVKNQSKFCRKLKMMDYEEWEIIASDGADLIVDEGVSGGLTFDCLSSQDDDQIVVLVLTGWRGDVTTRNIADEADAIDVIRFESHGFCITELQTVFRSTRQIQKFFHKFNLDENKNDLISGHNFDGVKVEEHIFYDEKTLKDTLEERIRLLIEIEGCEAEKIGLFQPEKYEKPRFVGNIFNNYFTLRSLEFTVMIVVEPGQRAIYLALSRAICHLIFFAVSHRED